MGVGLGAAVARKMFEAGEHPEPAYPLHEGLALAGHCGRVWGKATAQAADGGAVRVDVHIRHRREVQVDSHLCQNTAHTGSGRFRSYSVVASQLLGRREGGKAVFGLESLNLSSFLIHGNEQGDGRAGLEITR